MHRTGLHDRRIEITLFEPKNMRAISALLPEAFVHQIQALWDSPLSWLLGAGEREIVRQAKARGSEISSVDYQLRLQFWFEYNQQQENPDRHYPALNMSRVIGKAISKEAFYKHVLTDPFRLAYILTPPENYMASLEFVLQRVNNKMIEIMDLPLVDKNGTLDHKLVNQLSKIIERFHRYVRSINGDFVTQTPEGRARGASMSKKKIEQAAPPESASDKEARMKIEIEQLEKQAEQQRMVGQGGS